MSKLGRCSGEVTCASEVREGNYRKSLRVKRDAEISERRQKWVRKPWYNVLQKCGYCAGSSQSNRHGLMKQVI